MLGKTAASILNKEMDGMSVHRRALSTVGHFHDLHVRLTDGVIYAGQMADDFLIALGVELAGLDHQVYIEVVQLLQEVLNGPNAVGSGYGSVPVLLTEDAYPAVFQRLRSTLFYTIVRNYMGKSFDLV